MKLFLKILFFIFTMLITMGEVKSSTVVNVLQEEISYLVFQELHAVIDISENHLKM